MTTDRIELAALERARTGILARRNREGLYWLSTCPHCGAQDYQHALDEPAELTYSRLQAYCETCGVVEYWSSAIFQSPDVVSIRVLGPAPDPIGPQLARI